MSLVNWRESAIVVARTSSGTASQLKGPADSVRTQSSGVVTCLGGRVWEGARRSGNASPSYVEENMGAFPGFHDLLDPNTPRRKRGFEMADWILNVIAVGACSYAWGIHDYTTVNDPTTLVGVGFEHGADYVLKTFLRDQPGGVGNRILHQTVTTQLASSQHELRLVIDGMNKSIGWWIDGVQVDSFSPTAAIDQTGGSATVMAPVARARGFVPANGDMTIRFYGGEISEPILSLREFT